MGSQGNRGAQRRWSTRVKEIVEQYAGARDRKVSQVKVVQEDCKDIALLMNGDRWW